MKKSFGLLGLLLAAFSANIANAGIVIEATPDVDLMPGTQTISLRVLYDPTLGDLPSEGFNGVGVDIAWFADPGVTVTPLSHLISGTLADSATPGGGSLGNWDYDNYVSVAGSFAGSGHEVDNLGLANPDPGVFAGNLGGGGYFDSGGSFFTSQAGGASTSPTLPLELFTVDFEVTGLGGDSVTFVPFGVVASSTADGSLGSGSPPMGVDGDFLVNGAITAPDNTLAQGFQSGSVTFAAVPEPSSLSVFALIGFAAVGRRRRR